MALHEVSVNTLSAGTAPWVLDVTTGERALETTGGKTWDAARKMCSFLEQTWQTLPIADDAHVLELGSGTGWLGMSVARNVASSAGASVILTEQRDGGAMEWLEHNVERNRVSGVPLDTVRTIAFDWADLNDAGLPSSIVSTASPDWPNSVDLLIGSDLVYDGAGVNLLPKVFRYFAQLAPGMVIFYAHTLHRFDHMDIDFFQALRNESLSYRPVAAEGGCDMANDASLDPLSGEGYLEDLFAEQRIAIFQIWLEDSSTQSRPLLSWSNVLSDGVVPASDSAWVQQQAELPCSTDSSNEAAGMVRVGRIRVLLPCCNEPDEDGELFTVRLRFLGPFGSGEHPTTALMLRAMQELQDDGRLEGLAVCDYGCGSGILALAAHRLGAVHCVGVDLIPEALDAARANRDANGADSLALHLPRVAELEHDLEFYSRYGDWRSASVRTRGWEPLPELQEAAFDLVVANIVVGSLCRAAAALKWLTKPGGRVLLAGMRDGMVDQVYEAYGNDFDLIPSASLDGWALLQGTCRSAGGR